MPTFDEGGLSAKGFMFSSKLNPTKVSTSRADSMQINYPVWSHHLEVGEKMQALALTLSPPLFLATRTSQCEKNGLSSFFVHLIFRFSSIQPERNFGFQNKTTSSCYAIV